MATFCHRWTLTGFWWWETKGGENETIRKLDTLIEFLRQLDMDKMRWKRYNDFNTI